MSYQQAFDSVDTQALNKQNWPSLADFHYPQDILKWRDIPTGVFKILARFERGESKYGLKGLILKLEPLSGPCFLVWAPGSLIFALENHEETKFVQNLGVKIDANGYQYFDFKLALPSYVTVTYDVV